MRFGKKGNAWSVMDQAYDAASDGGRLPVPRRQMFYSVRRILLQHGLDCPSSHQFMNGAASILSTYLDEHTHTTTWDIISDARGSLVPPHGEPEIPLSTLAVRSYLDDAASHDPSLGNLGFGLRYPVRGPGDGYGAVLYIEKEGFGPVIEAAGLQDRYDLAVVSSKGYGTDAAKDILAACDGRYDVPVLVAHDFDKDGINIAEQLRMEGIEIIEIGLRWDDLQDPRWGLMAMVEPVPYIAHSGPYDPRPHLFQRGATSDEVNLLCSTAVPGVEYSGHRVELNALVGTMFVDWLEDKLDAHSIGKVVPSASDLEAAYRRAYEVETINHAVRRVRARARRAAASVEVPRDLETQVSEMLDANKGLRWDDIIAHLVRTAAEDGD